MSVVHGVSMSVCPHCGARSTRPASCTVCGRLYPNTPGFVSAERKARWADRAVWARSSVLVAVVDAAHRLRGRS